MEKRGISTEIRRISKEIRRIYTEIERTSTEVRRKSENTSEYGSTLDYCSLEIRVSGTETRKVSAGKAWKGEVLGGGRFLCV